MPTLPRPCQWLFVLITALLLTVAIGDSSALAQGKGKGKGGGSRGGHAGGNRGGGNRGGGNWSGGNRGGGYHPGGTYGRGKPGVGHYGGYNAGTYRGYGGRSGSSFYLGINPYGLSNGPYGLSNGPYGLSYGYRNRGIGIGIGVVPSYGYRAPFYGYPGYAPYSSGPYYPEPYPYYAAPYPYYAAPPVYREPFAPTVVGYPVAPDANESAPRLARAVPDNLIPTAEAAARSQATAEQSLRAGRFEAAVQSSVRAVAADPENGKLHLFQSLAFFAFGDYRSAADSIRQGLAKLEESDWGQLVEHHDSFYPGNAYQTQLDRLDDSAERNPSESHLQFLTGYHYLYSGDTQMAHYFLSKAVELDPADPLTARLLALSVAPLPTASDPTAADMNVERPSGE